MLKKKNIAMMMAAATVATTVAPVFAAVDTEIVTDEAKLIADVKEMLETRYTNVRENGKGGVATEAYQNSVYEIIVTGTSNVIENVAELKALIEANKVNDATLNITVTDKGHKVVDGVTYATEKNEYVKYTTSDISGIAATLTNANIGTAAQNDTTTATITLTNTSVDPIVVTTDDYKLDLTKPVDKDGNLVALTADVATGKKVVGFKTLETGKVVENDIPAKVIAKYDFRNGGFTKIEANATDYIAGGIYTEAGAELVNMLVKANANTNGSDTVRVVKGGKAYNVVCNTDSTTNDLSAVEANKDGGYKLTVNLKVTAEVSRAVTAGSNTQITIKSDSQKELADLRAAMVKANVATDLVEAGKGVYTTLAGDDRFETAIAISKESYKNHDDATAGITPAEKANAVVLVGEDAIVDGLAAAPLAKQKDAPILLTKKDAVGDTTLAEMKRVVEKGSTVYLIGGEAVISKDVEAQLVKEMNAKIVRLAGEDRFETSTEIANAMINASSTMTEVFIVGGDGEADAMSIASVASMKTSNVADSVGTVVAPIIVTPATGLTKDAKHFVEMNASTIANVGVIGGESKVSTKVLKDIKDADASVTTSRIAGETRHETNAEVIRTYFSGAANTNVYVAKDGYVGGNGKLIDALSVAPLAGRNNAPIVLATEDLTKEQAEIIDARTTPAPAGTPSTNKLTKVGNGISSTVMSKLVKILGL